MCIFNSVFFKERKIELKYDMILKLFIFNAVLIADAYSYTKKIDEHGKLIRWKSRFINFKVLVNPANAQGLSDDFVYKTVQESINDWNSKLNLNINMEKSSSNSGSGILNNTLGLYFSNDSRYFSSKNISAITKIMYKNSSGEILDADIIINNDSKISEESKDINYFGNIISHEIGHLLGLGHSEVKNASMFRVLGVGQHLVSKDEVLGLKNIYDADLNGSIAGKIIGGPDRTGIFGAHVQVISLKNGSVIAGVYSDYYGNFKISHLDLNDNYYLYVSPAKVLSSLPDYYYLARNDFCYGRTKYKGSFYQGCGSSKIGYPEGITISSQSPSINIGEVTIRCGLSSSHGYLKSLYSNNSFNIKLNDSDKNKFIEKSFVGVYKRPSISNGVLNTTGVNIVIDVSDLSVEDESTYLDIKYISDGLFSKGIVAKSISNESKEIPDLLDVLNKSNEGRPTYDFIYRHKLEKENNNLIYINLATRNEEIFFKDYLQDGSSVEFLYPDYSNYIEDNYFYFLTLNLSKKTSDSNYNLIKQKLWPNNIDNKKCPKASNAYSVVGESDNRLSISSQKNVVAENDSNNQNDSIKPTVSCGTISDNGSNGPPSSLLFVVMGFLFINLIFFSFSNEMTIRCARRQ